MKLIPGNLDLADQGRPVSETVRTGALSSGDRFRLNLVDSDRLRYMHPAEVLTVISPYVSTGAHANLDVIPNGNPQKTVRVIGGGNSIEIPGPIYDVTIVVRDNAVAGSGDDDIQLIFSGRGRGVFA